MTRTALLACLTLAGCKSDLTPGESGTDTDDSAGSSGGSTGGAPENLLINPGFEEWAGASTIGWTPSVDLTIEQGTDSPAEGQRYVRAIATGYAEFQQSVSLPATLDAGANLAVELSYRRAEGDTTAPGVDLYGQLASGDEMLLPAVSPPPFAAQGWTTGGGAIVLPEPITGVRVAIVVGGVGAQTVELDDVRLWAP